ncbi:enkurin-like [Gouania willdenowi]|uniref:Enkurin-like n=1 Tax=Gouania willdenowi TaxID=441366 RepID=A0A8C5I155_GOUWI|nr:enkurin-like [Gouania willdenowi]
MATKPRYVSVHRPRIMKESGMGKNQRKTWGPAQEELPNPKNYLRKHSREQKLPETITINPPKYSSVNQRLLALPPRREKLAQENLHFVRNQETSPGLPKIAIPLPKMTLTRLNVDSEGPQKVTVFPEIITPVPRKPVPTCVDTCKGHKYLLKNSGLVPQHALKKGYGEAPRFVHQHKQKVIQKAKEQERRIQEHEAKRAQEYADANNVLEDLEQKLETLFVEHHRLPVVLDLRHNQIRKEKIEKAMDQVEKDIERVKRFIANYYSS